MHCIHCGTTIADGSTSCPSCGRSQSVSPDQIETTPYTPPESQNGGDDVRTTGEVGELGARLQDALGDEYAVEGPIGQGGFAVVFRVRDRSLKRSLAVKVISPELIVSKTVVERFRREAETIAQLSHAHIVPVHFVGHKEDLFYLAMAFVEGESLAERLARVGKLPIDEAARIFREVASALDLAHRRGVIHRDIKPHNVLLEKETGRALLTDFGIARTAEGGQLTATGMVVGTPAYMSPEQVTGEAVDHRSDIYALGIVAYEMLVGRPPFTGATPEAVLFKRVAEPPQPVEKANPEVPPDLAHIVNECVAPEPEHRIQSAREIVEALGGVTPTTGSRVTHARPRLRRARGRRLAAGLVFGAAAVGVTLFFVFRGGGESAPAGPAIPSTMVIIPGGTYSIGRDDGPEYGQPAHPVTLDSFAIERTEVTVGAYRAFVDSTPTPAPWDTPPDSMLPVTGVTWAEAQAYCAWRYDGGRLPTEEEWEAAARGLEGRRYPWGNSRAQGAANTASEGDTAPMPVGSMPGGANALGVQDLIGNVWEWTSSRMEPYPGGTAPPDGARYYVSRGGAYNSSDDVVDASFRGYMRPTDTRENLQWTGFRCAMSLRGSTGKTRER